MSSTCVWVDHSEARIFILSRAEVHGRTVSAAGPKRHIHRKADHLRMGTKPMDADFLADIAEALTGATAVLLLGPGRARTELAGYLGERHPQIAKRIWANEPMDHPTNGEIVAYARQYFDAARRMHQ